MYSACLAHLKSKHGIMRLGDKRKEHETHVKTLNQRLRDCSKSIIASPVAFIFYHVFVKAGKARL